VSKEISNLVRQGFTSGKGWELSAESETLNDETAVETIAGQIENGFTEGYQPRWVLRNENEKA